MVVNDSLPISEKIDSHWEDIKGFGGDRHIAKKILFCYYPEKIIPAYKTKDLEKLAKALGSKYRKKSYKKYSVGQKFELLNGLILAFKNQHAQLRNLDNGLFVAFLYKSFLGR
ncbi:MAG: hypothetical protein C0412_21475 [Flavobacterium sp.]|nr:hypothetical protein [Flavobacterium sp.]